MLTREEILAVLKEVGLVGRNNTGTGDYMDMYVVFANAVSNKQQTQLAAVTKQRDIAVAALKWIDDNTTFYDVKHPVDDAANVPTLASVSKRIWYHATDDQVSYPFSAIALSQIEGETK